MRHFSFISLNAIQTNLRITSVLVAAVASACSSGGETDAAAGSWSPLTVKGPDAPSVPPGIVGIGTALWLEPTDLSTGLAPDRLRLGVGLLNRKRVLDPREIEAAADSAQLVRWPEGSVVPSEAEIEVSNPEAQLHDLGARATEVSETNRAKVKVVPIEPLEPGWYALKAGRDGPVSRFHVGSCPIVVGLRSCEDMDVVAVVFSEPVGVDADVRVLSRNDGKRCRHDSHRFENRNQSKSMRRYVRCNVDATKETLRVRVGDVTVRKGKKLGLPAGIEQDGVSSLDISPQIYEKIGRCSHARAPLSAPLPRCF